MLTDIKLSPSCSFVDYTVKGEILNIRQWGNPSSARGVALLVHGLGAQSSWFEAASRELASRGFLVLAYDQRGFGTRADIHLLSYNEWIDDLSELVTQLRAKYCELPIYLLGNSMGALVVMAASNDVLVDGIVICSPGFDGHPRTFTFSYKVKSILSALLNPSLEVTLPYCSDIVSRDPNMRKWLTEESQMRRAVPGTMLFELMKLSQNVIGKVKSTKAPVLMITAGQEQVVNNIVSERLFEKLDAPSKKHVCMADAWHDLMFDPQVDEVAEEISRWQSGLVAAKR